jgi:hypothetical protein
VPGKVEFTAETRDAIRKQNLKDWGGPRGFYLTRKLLRGSSFYLPRFHELRTIFMHVPKSAGSSLGASLFGTDLVGHFEWSLYEVENPTAFRSYYKFCFVRDPVTRFLSAYNYLVEGGKAPYDAAMGSDVLKYGGVNEFVEFGLKRDRWYRLRHFRPQSLLVCDRNLNLKVDFVGRFESFDIDCQVVAKALGVEFSPTKTNVTRRKTISSRDLTPKSVSILRDVYQSDYKAFDYEISDAA